MEVKKKRLDFSILTWPVLSHTNYANFYSVYCFAQTRKRKKNLTSFVQFIFEVI